MTGKSQKPLIPYLRQSRAKEQTISIDEQRRDIRRWADAHGVQLAAEIVEQGVSGSKSWRERGLGEAVAMCERGEASGVIVAWQDRLSRENMAATAEVWQALGDAKARLVCAAEGLDTATGDAELTFTVKAAIARDNWKRYRDNWKRAQDNAHERNVPNGRAAVGYRKRKGQPLQIDKRQSAKVRDAFERRAAGEPYASIGRRYGWSHSTTRQIIGNDVYLGVLRCGERVKTGAHDPIVSRDLFDRANAARTKRPVPPGETTRDRLLLGLARCAGCGHTLKTVRRPRADGTYLASYFCKDAASEPCPERAYVHADDLDAFVSDWFERSLRMTPHLVDVVAAERDLALAQRERDTAEAELAKFVETASALDAAFFQRGISFRQLKLDEARERVAAASARTTTLPVGGPLIDLWRDLAPDARRNVLQGFIDRIDVRRGASSDLARHVSIVWADGTVAHKEERVRVQAA